MLPLQSPARIVVRLTLRCRATCRTDCIRGGVSACEARLCGRCGLKNSNFLAD
jgi:hypothetical protein